MCTLQIFKLGNVIMSVSISMLFGWLEESCSKGDGYLRSNKLKPGKNWGYGIAIRECG